MARLQPTRTSSLGSLESEAGSKALRNRDRQVRLWPRRPEKLSLQSLGIDALPVEFGFVRPVLVDPWVNIVSERSVQIVIAGPLLEIHIKLQFSDAFLQPHLLCVRLDLPCLQFVQSLLLLEEASL